MRIPLLCIALAGIAPMASATDYTVTSWTELDSAWSAAISGDRILIPANTTIEVPMTLDFSGRALTVMGLDQATSVLEVSSGPLPIGTSGNRIFDFTSGEGYDSHVRDLVLRGRTNWPMSKLVAEGGLVYVKSWLHEEDPTTPGGPIKTINTNPRFERVTFESAIAMDRGGAVRVTLFALSENLAPPQEMFTWMPTLFESCRFVGNESKNVGGAVSVGGGYAGPGSFAETGPRAAFFDCRFEGNLATEDAGALSLGGAVVEVENSLFEGNSVGQPWSNGSAILMGSNVSLSRLAIKNCTLSSNSGQSVVYQTGYAHSIGLAGEMTVENTIIWGNVNSTAFLLSLGDEFGADLPQASYSNISMPSGTYPGVGNLNVDPAFTVDRHLDQLFSPCVDAGNPLTLQAGRMHAKTTSTTGNADSGVVDMGFHHLGQNNPRYFGIGNVNTSGVRATIDFSGAPVAGTAASIDLQGGLPYGIAALLYSFGEGTSPLSLGTLWLSFPGPATYKLVATDGQGAASFPLPASLPIGLDLFVEYVIVEDLLAGVYSTTGALEIVLQ